MHQLGTKAATATKVAIPTTAKRKMKPIMAVRSARSNTILIKKQAKGHRVRGTILPGAVVVELKYCGNHYRFTHRRFLSKAISRKRPREAKKNSYGTGRGELAGRMPTARILHTFKSSNQVHSTTMNWRE